MLQCTLHLDIHGSEQTQYVNYHAFNSHYISRKQNKTHTFTAQNKVNFTAVNISIGQRHCLPKYRNIGHRKFDENHLTIK